MRQDPRDQKDSRSSRRDRGTEETFRRNESRPESRDASQRRDWYENDSMDERSGYRDEDRRASYESRNDSDYRSSRETSSPDYHRVGGSRDQAADRRASDGSRQGISYDSANFDGHQERSRQTQFVGRGPKSFKRSDERIKEDVCEMLTLDANIDAESIEVEVKDGEVTLSGTVPERRMKHLAEDCIERIFGVKDISNNLRVSRDSATQGSNRKTASGSTPTLPSH